MNKEFKPVITVFHCVNANGALFPEPGKGFDLREIKLPCSSMVKDVFLLRAFEAGADGVVILACPEGECRYIDGNKRARKRMERVRTLLDEIGIGGQRLTMFNLSGQDNSSLDDILNKTARELKEIGPNLAA